MLKCLWFFLFIFFSCASPPNPIEVIDNIKDIKDIKSIAINEGTAIRTSPKAENSQDNFSTYFNAVDLDILLLVEKGSPESIRDAVVLLRNSSKNYSEQDKVLLAICASILKYAWPSEKITWEVPTGLPDNVYTSTLASIDRGIYENAFEGGDFFSLVLPSLVLLSAPSVTNYYAEAQKSLEKAMELDAESVLALYLAGILNIRMENYDAAIIYLEKARNLDLSNINIVYPYLSALLESGSSAEVFDLGKQLVVANPLDMEILKLYANAAFDVGDYVIAESLVAQILQREPDNLSLLLLRSRILFQLEEYLTVSSLLDVYSRIDKNNKEYLLLRAQLQSIWNKNTTAALRTIQEALILYPKDTDVILLAAELATVSGQMINGKPPSDLLAPVLEKDPGNVRALEILVKESVGKKEWQKAYNASTILAKDGAFTLDAAIIHTEICIELNLMAEARRTIEHFYTSNTEDEVLQQWYIRLLIAEGKNAEVSNLIERLLSNATRNMKSILYFERSRLAVNDTQILSDLRSSLTSNPRNEFALYGLYVYYYDRNDYSKAQYYLKQVIALNPSDTELLQRNTELIELLR